jgi:hypothetical protein
MTNERHLAPSCEMHKTNLRESKLSLFLGSISVHPFPSPPNSIGDKFFPKSVKNCIFVLCAVCGYY